MGYLKMDPLVLLIGYVAGIAPPGLIIISVILGFVSILPLAKNNVNAGRVA